MAGEHSTAGIIFKIGDKKIPGCFSTPDMGSEPEKIDVTSFDDTKNKRYIPGLMDVQTLNFDFYSNGTNYAEAKSLEKNTSDNSYSVIYPDNDTISFTGSHTAYKLAAEIGQPIKFRISVTINGEINSNSPSTTTTTTGS